MSPLSIKITWDTPAGVSALANRIDSPRLQQAPYSFVCSIFPASFSKNNHLIFVVTIENGVVEQKALNTDIVVTIYGKKKREVKRFHTFSSQSKMCIFDDFLDVNDIQKFAKKDKLSICISISESNSHSDLPDCRKTTGYIGLINMAATCYMNSVIQMLFHIPAFRRLIYAMPIGKETEDKNVPLNLQRLFCMLQMDNKPVSTKNLIKSFGWTSDYAFEQNDIQEFIRLLISNLEEKMKGTSQDGEVANLFKGTTNHYIRCINVDFSTSHQENFYDISVVVKGKNSLEESLSSLIEDELLNGNNQYKTDDFGLQDAVMGCRFESLPPILHFHLARFEFDCKSVFGMTKVKDCFKYPLTLDMKDYVEKSYQGCTVYELFAVLVHIGNNLGGHYIAYCRPGIENKWFRFNDSLIEEVGIEDVTERNFGSEYQQNHAYYLCYIRQNDIRWIMQSISISEIPSSLYDYYQQQKDLRDPEKITVTIANHPKQQHFQISKTATYSRLTNEIKKYIPDFQSLWTASINSMPFKYIEPKKTVLQTLGTIRRIYAGNFKVKEQDKPDLAFSVKFFYPNQQSPIQDLGFIVVKSIDKINIILPEIKKRAGFKNDVSLICFCECNNKVIDADLTKQFQQYTTGILIFQLDSNSINSECTFKFEELKDEKQNIFKVRNLIPEIKLDNAMRYINHIKGCINVNIFDYENKNLFTVEIPSTMHMKILIRCIKNAMNLSDQDSIGIYLPSQDETKPTLTLINRKINENIKTSLNIKGKIKETKVFIKIFRNVEQNLLNLYIPLTFQLLNHDLDQIANVNLEMPGDSTVSDLIQELKKREDVPKEISLRIVLLSNCTIIRKLEGNEPLSDIINMEIRAEFIPEPQLNMEPGSSLLRCSFSNNINYPPNGTVLSPFYFKIEQDEDFELTNCRIQSMIQNNLGELKYVLYCGQRSIQRFINLNSTTILSDIAKEPDCILYIIVQPSVIYQILQRSNHHDMKIYN